MAKQTILKERGTGEILYPQTLASCVQTADGGNVDEGLEKAKFALFVDMWNEACLDPVHNISHGRYNEATGYFEYGPVKDLTYKDALAALMMCVKASNDYPGRYNLKYDVRVGMSCFYQQYGSYTSHFGYARSAGNMEYALLTTNTWQGAWSNNLNECFLSCRKLRRIEPFINMPNHVPQYPFKECYLLEHIELRDLKSDLSLKDSPLLSLHTFQYLVANATNKTPITVTVHADVYAKLTGDTTNEAAAALTEEEAAAWQQVLADAVAKNISFATA